jgi:hypothetical protein
VELNIRLTVLVVETARLERRGVNDTRYGSFLTEKGEKNGINSFLKNQFPWKKNKKIGSRSFCQLVI